MNRLDALQIFVRVAELSSFTRTADLLGLPKASVSTAVQQLEAELGVRLLHRTTRRVELTQDGRAFCERAKDLLADVDELATMFQGGQALSGRLRVDMSSGLASQFIVPRLPAFLARQVSARCIGGVLHVSPPKSASLKPSGSWVERRRAPGFNLFYADLETDARARLAALSPRP